MTVSTRGNTRRNMIGIGGRRCLGVAAVAAAATTMVVATPAQASAAKGDTRAQTTTTTTSPVQVEQRGPRRQGGQFELLVGATACMPGETQCSISNDGADGRTWPSFGAGANLGWRINPYVMIGAAYRYGMFHPDYDLVAAQDYQFGHQQSVYAIVRPIIPIGRVDIGLDIGPGYSGQFFELSGNNRDFSHGFSFIFGPSIDVFLTDRFFLGAKVDFLLNSHRQICQGREGTTTCRTPGDNDIAPVHQVIYGLHIGGTFGN